MLKFLQIGLGSMGKRRIRNLLFHNEKNIVGFDILPERIQEVKTKHKIKVIDDLNKISPKDFDVIIISVPPNKHGDYIRMALQNKKHFFVEHPVSDDGYKDIFKNKDLDIVKAPSCTMRFYAPIKMIKDILKQGKIGKIVFIYARRNIPAQVSEPVLEKISPISGDMVHDVDLMLWFTQGKIKSVYECIDCLLL